MNAGRCGCFLGLASLSVIHAVHWVDGTTQARSQGWVLMAGQWPPPELSVEDSMPYSKPCRRGLIPGEGLLEEVRAQLAEQSGIRLTRLVTMAIWFPPVS